MFGLNKFTQVLHSHTNELQSILSPFYETYCNSVSTHRELLYIISVDCCNPLRDRFDRFGFFWILSFKNIFAHPSKILIFYSACLYYFTNLNKYA